MSDAREDVATTEAAVAAARQAVDRLDDGLRQAAAAFHAQRDSVAAAGPPAPAADLAEAWQRAGGVGGRAAAGRRRPAPPRRPGWPTEAEAARGRIEDGLAAQAAAVGVGGHPLAVAAARAEEQARHALQAIDDARRAHARLTAEVDEHRRRYAVAHELGRHLSSAGFPRWLVGEALDLLVADASVLLRQLSGGQYSLAAVDGGSDLAVIDHANADELRPVRSLSGGETFQASLAFALALSDHLASLTAATRRAPLGSTPSSSTRASAPSTPTAWTRWRPPSRPWPGAGAWSGIVTHVRELAERVPVRYVVRKGPRTATVERVVA